ncbi:MAG: ImmA/IrrE family metallo-endopeptidase [Candidatus Eisenbacteria bacterium]
MAVINGIVGNNTHRKLDVEEFRGFALVDPVAPLIFVIYKDARSAQMFTLAHELAHVWLEEGEGVPGFEDLPGDGRVEQFCDRASRVPRAGTELRESGSELKRTPDASERLAREFKVSPIVAGRRAMDLRLVDRRRFFEFYEAYSPDGAAEGQGISWG